MTSERQALAAQIRVRRDALTEQQQRAIAQYNTLEEQLNLLRRNIDGMSGGVQELDQLLATLEAT